MTDFIDDDEQYCQLGGDEENSEEEEENGEEENGEEENDEGVVIEGEEDDDEEEDDDDYEDDEGGDYGAADDYEGEGEPEDEDSDDYDDSSEEEDFEKVDNEFKKNFIATIHPENIHETYEDIKVKTQVKRNQYDLIIDENHKTIPILTKYERARILGLRITQLNKGAKPYIDITKNKIIDNHIIAEQELNEKRLPFIIMRPIPNGKKEYWRLEDLEVVIN